MSDLTCGVCGSHDARFIDPATGRYLCRDDRSLILANDGLTLEKAEQLVAYLTPVDEPVDEDPAE